MTLISNQRVKFPCAAKSTAVRFARESLNCLDISRLRAQYSRCVVYHSSLLPSMLLGPAATSASMCKPRKPALLVQSSCTFVSGWATLKDNTMWQSWIPRVNLKAPSHMLKPTWSSEHYTKRISFEKDDGHVACLYIPSYRLKSTWKSGIGAVTARANSSIIARLLIRVYQ